MRFLVSRTLSHSGEAPCEEARGEMMEVWDVRVFSSAEEYDARFPTLPKWTAQGTEHKILENGYIARRMDDVLQWTVDLPDMESLLSFVRKNGKCIVEHGSEIYLTPHIEIYDGYRE